jgi:YD repeat-containing protein
LSAFDLVQRQHPDGTSESYVHDPQGRLLQRIDTGGHPWSWSYNVRGLPLTATNPSGGVAQLTYGPDMALQTFRDPSGTLTTIARDLLKRPIEVVHADGTKRLFTWTARDRLAAVTDELGLTRTQAYDDDGNPTALIDRTGASWISSYDALGRRTSLTDPLGNTWSVAFGPQGRVVALTSPTADTWQVAYDARGFPSSITAPWGGAALIAHDAEGLLSAWTTPRGHTWNVERDALGRVSSWTNPLGASSALGRDPLGRVISCTSPDGQTVAIGRGPTGLVTSLALPGGIGSVAIQRDGLGCATSVTDPNGGEWLQARDVEGRCTSRTDPLDRSTQLVYDARDRLVRAVFPGGLGTVDIERDDAGQPVELDFSDGTWIPRAYDAEGRLDSTAGVALQRDGAGNIAACNGIANEYDGSGRIVRVTLGPGKTVDYTYLDGLLSVIQPWVGGPIALSYDVDGLPLKIGRPNGVHTRFQWDAAGQLSALSNGSYFARFQRDSAGRIVRAHRRTPLEALAALGQEVHDYDAAHQHAGWTHDALGFPLSHGSATLTWNLAGQLLSHSEGGATVQFAWSGLGDLLARTDAAGTVQYVANHAMGGTTAIVLADGVPATYVVATPSGQPLATIDAATGAIKYLHFDERGNVEFTTNASGAVTGAWGYDAYRRIAHTGGDSFFTWRGSSGALDLGVGGLFAVGGEYGPAARVYDPALGRMLAPQPTYGERLAWKLDGGLREVPQSWLADDASDEPRRQIDRNGDWAPVGEDMRAVKPSYDLFDSRLRWREDEPCGSLQASLDDVLTRAFDGHLSEGCGSQSAARLGEPSGGPRDASTPCNSSPQRAQSWATRFVGYNSDLDASWACRSPGYGASAPESHRESVASLGTLPRSTATIAAAAQVDQHDHFSFLDDEPDELEVAFAHPADLFLAHFFFGGETLGTHALWVAEETRCCELEKKNR